MSDAKPSSDVAAYIRRLGFRAAQSLSKPLVYNDDSQEMPSGARIQQTGARREKKKPHKINGYFPSGPAHLTLFRGWRQGGFKLAHQGRQPVAYRLVERAAVPARGFADCARAASDPASPVLRPGREELARRRLRQLQKLLQVLTSAARS